MPTLSEKTIEQYEEELIKRIEANMGLKIKKITIDAKLFIVERKEIMFYVFKDGKQDDVAIWLNSELFAQAFAELFEKAVGSD